MTNMHHVATVPAANGRNYDIFRKGHSRYVLKRALTNGSTRTLDIHIDDVIPLCDKLIDLKERDERCNGHVSAAAN